MPVSWRGELASYKMRLQVYAVYSYASELGEIVRSCVAAGCAKTNKDGIGFFKFPSDPVMRQ